MISIHKALFIKAGITRTTGFTLIELIICLLVISILLTVGVPSLTASHQKYRADSNLRKIQQHLLMARNHAISYGTKVTVCPLQNNICVNNWKQEISIFSDNDTYAELDAEDTLISKLTSFHQQDFVQYSRRAIRFLPTGLASGANGTFKYCPASKTSPYSQAIIINNSGRIRMSSDTQIDCQ